MSAGAVQAIGAAYGDVDVLVIAQTPDGGFIVRRWWLNHRGDVIQIDTPVHVAEDLVAARAVISSDRTRMAQPPLEHPDIVEVWW